MAAEDKEIINGDCGGCIKLLHNVIKDGSGDLNSFYRLQWDAYPFLIIFGVICGVSWMVSGGLGFINAMMGLVAGTITYLIFVILFPIIMEMVQYSSASFEPLPCARYLELQGINSMNTTNITAFAKAGCKTSDNFYEKHKYDSFDFFWGAALACFILGAYQLAGMVYEVYTTAQDQKKPDANLATKEGLIQNENKGVKGDENKGVKGDENKDIKKDDKKDIKKDDKKDIKKDDKKDAKKDEKKDAKKDDKKDAKKDDKKDAKKDDKKEDKKDDKKEDKKDDKKEDKREEKAEDKKIPYIFG